jgi:hypothetical protein
VAAPRTSDPLPWGRVLARRVAQLPLLATLPLWSAPALAQVPDEGPWTLSEGVTTAQVSAWGPDCGPRPEARAEATGATYRWTGGALRPERPPAAALFARGVCGAASGLVDLRETRALTRIRCSSADPARRVEGEIRLSPSPGLLTVTHRFDYDWTFRGQRCAAVLQTTWTLRGEAPRPAPAVPCAAPGPLAQLVAATPLRRQVAPGGLARLAVRGSDADGCAVEPDLRWEASEGEVDGAGRWRPSGLAPGAQARVTARSGALAVTFVLTVSHSAAPAVDWAPRVAGEPAEADASLTIPPADPSARMAAAVGGAPAEEAPRRRWLVALFVAFGLLVCALGLWIALSARRLRREGAQAAAQATARGIIAQARARRGPPRVSGDPAEVRARPAPLPLPVGDQMGSHAAPLPPVEGAATVPRGCPSCGRTFDATTRFCPHDGVALVTELAEAMQAPRPRRCPRCGEQFPVDATFCPHDGTPLRDPDEAPLIAREKTCPRCHTHYALDTEYCGLDGARLVRVN